MRAGVLAVAAALLAACGADDPAGNGNGAGTGEPQAGGSMTLMHNLEPRSLDPAFLQNDMPLHPLVGNALYGQLMTVSAEGDVDYGMAESLESSDGGTTWQLTLREGLTFSDGTPFDAEAVRSNWERLRDGSVQSSLAQYAVLIDTMTASGQTLDFTVVRPIGRFGIVIATQLNWIAAPEALQAGQQAFDQNPVGAGPFVLDSWQRGGQMVLTRNDNYHEESQPYLDELTLVTNNDSEQRLSTVVSGGADGALLTSGDQLVTAEEQGLEITYAPHGGNSTVFTFNTQQAPFDDVRARLAVSQAVDWDAVDAAVYAGNGEVPEAWFPEDSERSGSETLPDYDPEAAQALFDELAAEGAPVEFVITSPQSTEPRRASENIQAQLTQYDSVDVELEVLDSATVLSRLAQRDYQTGFTGFFTDPVSMYNLFHSGSAANQTGLSDPELDTILDALLAATDAEALTETSQAASERLTALMPGRPYVRNVWGMAHHEQVEGAEFYGNGSPLTATLWLSD